MFTMDYLNNIKSNLFISNKFTSEYDFIFSNKLSFDIENIYKYVGYNDIDLDYINVYLSEHDIKKQLNFILLSQTFTKIYCLNRYIIVEDIDGITNTFIKNNGIINTFQ